jgi:chromosome segregation ATPase
MKLKVVIVVLVVACVGLAAALFTTRKHASEQHTADVTSISSLSNQLEATSHNLAKLSQINVAISNDLASSRQELTLGGVQLTQLSNSLVTAKAALADTETSLAGAQQQVTNLNSHIADLQSQNKALDDQVETLSNQLAQLTVQIEDTRKQLAVSQNKDTFLQQELQRQLALKSELEHKFNDIIALRSQVKKISDQMFIARHIELMKYDNGGKKPAELLMAHNNRPSNSKQPAAYDLNVEIGTDGSVKVIPPMGKTNSPAH